MQKDINLDSLGRTRDLSFEEVKSLESFKDWDERQILELTTAIKALSVIMYNNWMGRSKFGKEIALSNDNQINIKAAA